MTVEWGKYQDAYKAIWEKLDALNKTLESINQDFLLIKAYGSANQILKQLGVYPYSLYTYPTGSNAVGLQQRTMTNELLVQLRHDGNEIDPREILENGSATHFSKTATSDVITPTSGKAVKIKGFFYTCNADITTELRFKNSGNLVGGLPVKGSCGMNLIAMKKPQGAINEILEIYLSGTGTVKGWVSYEEV